MSRQQSSLLTAHNLLFTVLTLGLMVPKAVLAYQGQSAMPNTLDLAYGVFIALLFYWLTAYRERSGTRMRWYYEDHFPSVVMRLVRSLEKSFTGHITRIRARQAVPDEEATLENLHRAHFTSAGVSRGRQPMGSSTNDERGQIVTVKTASGVAMRGVPDGMRRRTAKPAQDDSNVTTRPNVQIDYLSHAWNDSEVSQSWIYMAKQKYNITNGLRLENASWRAWAKQRKNLKTVLPESLNWMKDSDVTWLYGPFQALGQSNSATKAHSSSIGQTKSVKKRRQVVFNPRVEQFVAVPAYMEEEEEEGEEKQEEVEDDISGVESASGEEL